MDRKWIIYSLLVLLFACSIFIRMPFIKNNVDYCEKGNIMLLTSIHAWSIDGASVHAFIPTLTWSGESNLYVSVYKRLEDKKGYNYFVSFPPFVFILVYFISYLIPQLYWPIMLHILALLIHLGICWLGYLIARKYLLPTSKSSYAVIAFIILAFSPTMLYHGLYIFPGLVVLFLLLCFVNLFLEIEKHQLQISIVRGLNLFTIVFLMIYTDWLGLLAVLAILVYIFFNARKKYLMPYTIVIIIAMFFAYVIFLFQLLSVVSFGEIIKSMGVRFIERSGWFVQRLTDQGLNVYNPDSYFYFAELLHKTLMPFGYLLIGILMYLIYKKKISQYKLYHQSWFWILLVSPFVLHSIILFNSTIIHLGEWAKYAIPIAFAVIMVIQKVELLEKINLKVIMSVVFILIVLSTVTFYSYMNQRSTTANNQVESVCKFIEKNIKPNQVIIIKTDSLLTDKLSLIEYILKHNVTVANNIHEAENFIRIKGINMGVFYTFDIEQGNYTKQEILLQHEKNN